MPVTFSTDILCCPMALPSVTQKRGLRGTEAFSVADGAQIPGPVSMMNTGKDEDSADPPICFAEGHIPPTD